MANTCNFYTFYVCPNSRCIYLQCSVGQARLAKFCYAVGVASTYEYKELFGVLKHVISILSAFNTIGLFIRGFRPLKATP